MKVKYYFNQPSRAILDFEVVPALDVTIILI